MTTTARRARARVETLAIFRDVGVIPVIRADSPDVAMRVVEALVDAELAVAEVTMTVPDALSVIEKISARFGRKLLLGAGTVTDAETATRAVNAGAEFIVSPVVLPDVIATASKAGVAVLPGALTPTEIFTAFQSGADMVKVFPAQAVGGAAYIRALRGPFPEALLVPTGGVTLQNTGDFIRAGAAAVGVGGELVQRDAIERGDYPAISLLARQFVDAVKAAR